MKAGLSERGRNDMEIVLRHEKYEGLSESDWLNQLMNDIADAAAQLPYDRVAVLVNHETGNYRIVEATAANRADWWGE